MQLGHLNMQGSTVQQQNIGEQITTNSTFAYGVPPEQKEAVDEMKRKLEPELQKQDPSISSILNDLTELALKNAPAFLTMVRLWFGK